MTRTREENAADLAREEHLRQVADAEVAADRSIVPERWMDYEEWLAWTGKDANFVGDGRTVSGSEDLYDAAMRAFEAAVPEELKRLPPDDTRLATMGQRWPDPQVFHVTTRDARCGSRTWRVTATSAAEARSSARQAAALDFIEPYESYRSDSDYLDDLDAAKDAVEMVSVAAAPASADGHVEGRPVANNVWLLPVHAPAAEVAPPDDGCDCGM